MRTIAALITRVGNLEPRVPPPARLASHPRKDRCCSWAGRPRVCRLPGRLL